MKKRGKDNQFIEIEHIEPDIAAKTIAGENKDEVLKLAQRIRGLQLD